MQSCMHLPLLSLESAMGTQMVQQPMPVRSMLMVTLHSRMQLLQPRLVRLLQSAVVSYKTSLLTGIVICLLVCGLLACCLLPYP